MNKHIILFDLDGTLIDSSEGITKSVQHTLLYYGITPPPLDELHCFIGPPLADSFVRFYHFSKEQSIEAVEVFRSRYNVTGYLECCLYPDTIEVLSQLKKDGYLLGVATSKPEDTARKILANLGAFELFDEICGATFDGKIETKDEVLQELFRRHPDYQSADMLLIGDTVYDVIGAKAHAIDSIGVSFGFGDIEQMKEAGAIAIASSMKDLYHLIEEN